MGQKSSKQTVGLTLGYQELTAVKVGKYVRDLPPDLLKNCLQALKLAEERLKRPVYVCDIVASWGKVS